jgi:hypothetical protein
MLLYLKQIKTHENNSSYSCPIRLETFSGQVNA